jgi:hypothetical protein
MLVHLYRFLFIHLYFPKRTAPALLISFQEALKWVTDQPAWQRSEGRDHVIPVHHPWSFKSVRRSVKKAIWLLPDMDSTGNWYYIHFPATFHRTLLTSHVPQLNSRTCFTVLFQV